MDNYEERLNEVIDAIKTLDQKDYTKSGKPNINSLTSKVKFSVNSGMLEDALIKISEEEEKEEEEEEREEETAEVIEVNPKNDVNWRLASVEKEIEALKDNLDRLYGLLSEKKIEDVNKKPFVKPFRTITVDGVKVKMYVNPETGEKTFEDTPETRRLGLKIKG